MSLVIFVVYMFLLWFLIKACLHRAPTIVTISHHRYHTSRNLNTVLYSLVQCLSTNVSTKIMEPLKRNCLIYLKDKFSQKWKFVHYLLSPMSMKSRVKFRSPKNTSGALQQNSIAASRYNTEMGSCLKKYKLASHSSSGIILVYRRNPKLIGKVVINIFSRHKIFTVAAVWSAQPRVDAGRVAPSH